MGKFMVEDTRTGKKYFGEINSPKRAEEKAFGVDSTDMLAIGNGPRQVVLPISAAAAHTGMTTFVDGEGWINCDAVEEPAAA